MIVFGVCALGVSGLYLMPSVASPPQPVSIRQAADDPQPRPSTSATVGLPQSGATGEAAEPADGNGTQPDPGRAAVVPQPTQSPVKSSASPTFGRTAYDPQDTPDSEPPTAVSTVSAAKVTADELSLTWPAATDNKRVIGYRVILNGYEVATTAETQVKLHWFNDEDGQHVVQIKAIDAAGNQSATWATLIVTRPSPGLTASPTPAATATAPHPTSTPSATESSSVAPTTDPSVQQTSTPTPSVVEPTVR
jgi:hypothetical protein